MRWNRFGLPRGDFPLPLGIGYSAYGLPERHSFSGILAGRLLSFGSVFFLADSSVGRVSSGGFPGLCLVRTVWSLPACRVALCPTVYAGRAFDGSNSFLPLASAAARFAWALTLFAASASGLCRSGGRRSILVGHAGLGISDKGYFLMISTLKSPNS